MSPYFGFRHLFLGAFSFLLEIITKHFFQEINVSQCMSNGWGHLSDHRPRHLFRQPTVTRISAAFQWVFSLRENNILQEEVIRKLPIF